MKLDSSPKTMRKIVKYSRNQAIKKINRGFQHLTSWQSPCQPTNQTRTLTSADSAPFIKKNCYFHGACEIVSWEQHTSQVFSRYITAALNTTVMNKGSQG